MFFTLINLVISQPLILFAGAFIFRLLAARGVPQSFDCYGHIYFAKELKLQKVGPFGSIKIKVVGGDKFSTPFMWHWFIGFFSLSFVSRYQKLFNPFIDAVFAVCIYFLAIKLGFEREDALLSFCLYVYTPMWFSRLSIGPRTSSFTPRLSGEIFTNVFFCVTILPIGAPSWMSILLGSVCCFYVLSSSKFGVQALLFLTPIISLFSYSLLPIFSLILGIFFLSTISKGAFLNSLKQQLGHLRWYFSKNLKGETAISDRNKLGKACLRKNKEPLFRYLLRLLYRLTSRNSYISVLVKMPVVFMLIGYWFTSPSDILSTTIVPVIAAVCIYFLVNLPQLLFLGEAERYLNHVAIFIVIGSVSIGNALHVKELLWFITLYGFLYLLVEAFVMPFLNKKSSTAVNDHSKILSYLIGIEKTVVLCYPYHAGGGVYRIMSETIHETVFPFGISEEFAKEFESEFGGKYPFIDLTKLANIHNSLGVDILIVSNSAVENNLDSNWRPTTNWNEVALGCELEKVYAYKS